MRNAYALLGLAFLIVFGGAYLIFETAQAPSSLEDNETSMSLTLTSSAFINNGAIPSQFTCDGENINPPLAISGAPEGTKSFVLVMDDPDIPEQIKKERNITKVNHWVLYNLPLDIKEIATGENVGTSGLNSRNAGGYIGPCPPPDMEPLTHRYIFRLYALSGTLNFVKAPTLDEVEEAAKGMAIESTQLIGVYKRNQ